MADRLEKLLACCLVLGLIALLAAAPASADLGRLSRITVKAGHSRLLDLPSAAKRVSVGRVEVADVVMVTPSQLYVNAKAIGSTNISLWDEEDRLMGVFEVQVVRDLTRLKERLFEIMSAEPVEVRELEDVIVLSGRVSSLEAKAQAASLAEAFAPKKVANLLELGGSQQVILKVRFAEVSRKVTKRMNFNLTAFNPLTGDFLWTMLGGVFSPVSTLFGTTERPENTDYGTYGPYQRRDTFGFEGSVSRNAGAMFGFKSGGTRYLGFLDILKENGLAKILAEPTLVATSGEEANFLAGGEFPIPVPQERKITIEFKEYGVKLNFKPEVTADNHIRLLVTPEVSELDFTTAVYIEGYAVPGLTTRKAKTQLELEDGQSFAMAGLFRDDIVEAAAKIPWLGDIPVLGALFRSNDFKTNKTELVIVVTPHIVKPGMGAPGPMPYEGLQEPDDLGFYLLGETTKLPEGPRTLPVSTSELEGRFGHEVVF